MLIRLILDPADEHRSRANQMRQWLSFQEHSRRGNASSHLDCRATLKQEWQLSYEELAFHLEDSASFRAFARLPLAWLPKKFLGRARQKPFRA